MLRRLLCVFTLVGCGAHQADAPPVSLRASALGSRVELRLIPSEGVRINARLKPTLELDAGGRVAFDAGRLTPDSAYFAEPPVAFVASPRRGLAGTLRLGVCPAGLSVCQSVTLRVSPSGLASRS